MSTNHEDDARSLAQAVAALRREAGLPPVGAMTVDSSIDGLLGRVVAKQGALLPGQRLQVVDVFGKTHGPIPKRDAHTFVVPRKRYQRGVVMPTDAYPITLAIDALEAAFLARVGSLGPLAGADRTLPPDKRFARETRANVLTRVRPTSAKKRAAEFDKKATMAVAMVAAGKKRSVVAKVLGVTPRMVGKYIARKLGDR